MTTTTADFVPADLDASKWPNIEPLLTALREREVDSPAALRDWLFARSELEAAISEAGALLYIDMTCHTEDPAAQAAYTSYIEDVAPKVKPAIFDLDRLQTEFFDRLGSPDPRYAVLERDTRAEVELFREDNVPIQTDLEKLGQEYQRITGSMTVRYDDDEKTLPQMGVYQESTDRPVREAAWRTVAERRLRDAEPIDDLFDKMIAGRHRVGVNAGFDNYVGYAFQSKHRFDYNVAECEAFHSACEEVVMPLVARLDAERREQLGLDALRPWDLGVDPKGRAPLRPFDGSVELVSKSNALFERLSPELSKMFAALGDGSNSSGAADGASLDLDTRKGKAPGGYQYMRDRSRVPFIFMNAAGLHSDVETMIHEAGHAFHSMYCVDEPLLHYRHAPMEFCEVASMAMELLTMPYWDAFYDDPADLAQARRKQLKGSVGLLPWIATIDAFQHWLYTNPDHTREARTEAWLRMDARFGYMGHRVDWDGLPSEREHVWQRQGHLFGAPFYYIEYGIAQLGALQLWLRSLEEGEDVALDAYRRAMSLGGSRPLPDLFEAAGLRFEFGPDIVGRLVQRVESELAKIPD